MSRLEEHVIHASKKITSQMVRLLFDEGEEEHSEKSAGCGSTKGKKKCWLRPYL